MTLTPPILLSRGKHLSNMKKLFLHFDECKDKFTSQWTPHFVWDKCTMWIVDEDDMFETILDHLPRAVHDRYTSYSRMCTKIKMLYVNLNK